LRTTRYRTNSHGCCCYPLIHGHINTQGRHSFMMPEAVMRGELRPLRNPADDPDQSYYCQRPMS
jgi:hypothetical protein